MGYINNIKDYQIKLAEIEETKQDIKRFAKLVAPTPDGSGTKNFRHELLMALNDKIYQVGDYSNYLELFL